MSGMYINVHVPRELQLQYMPVECGRSKKKLIIAGIAIAIILTLAYFTFGKTLIFGGNPYATPEKTVNTYLDASENWDADGIINCMYMENEDAMTRTFVEGMINTFKEMMEEGDISLSIVDRDIDVITQTEDTAKVQVSYTTKVTLNGSTSQQSGGEVLELRKTDDKWLIVDPSYEYYDYEMTTGG